MTAPADDNQSDDDRHSTAWFQLFYDLVLVAVIVTAGKIIVGRPTWSTAFLLTAGLLFVFSAWLCTSLSYGLYSRNSALRRLIVVVQMTALIIAALSATDGGLSTSVGFAAAAIVCVSLAALFLLQRHWGSAGLPSGLVVTACAIAAAVSLGSAVAAAVATSWPTYVSPLLLLASFLILAIAVAGPYLRRAMSTGRLDRAHLEERTGLLVIIVLGEGFLSLILQLLGKSTIPNLAAFVLGIAVPYSIWALYFTGVIRRKPPESVWRLRLWLILHAVLVLSIAGTAAALSNLTLLPLDNAAFREFPWSPLSPLLVVLSLMAITALQRDRDVLVVRAQGLVAFTQLVLVVLSYTVLDSSREVLTLVSAALIVLDALAVAILAGSRTARATTR